MIKNYLQDLSHLNMDLEFYINMCHQVKFEDLTVEDILEIKNIDVNLLNIEKANHLLDSLKLELQRISLNMKFISMGKNG